MQKLDSATVNALIAKSHPWSWAWCEDEGECVPGVVFKDVGFYSLQGNDYFEDFCDILPRMNSRASC